LAYLGAYRARRRYTVGNWRTNSADIVFSVTRHCDWQNSDKKPCESGKRKTRKKSKEKETIVYGDSVQQVSAVAN